MLPIHSKLKLILWKLGVEKTDAIQKVLAVRERKLHGSCSKSTLLRQFFDETKSAGEGQRRPSAGSRLMCGKEDTDLFFAAFTELASENDVPFSKKARLDASISEFLSEINPSYAVLRKNLGHDAFELLEFLEEYSIPKDKVLPSLLVMRNSKVREAYPKLFRDFWIIRSRAYTSDDRILCRESIAFDDPKTPVLTYSDSHNREYSGFTFFSGEKMIATSQCVGLPHLQSAVITIFTGSMGDGSYLATLLRFDSAQGRAHFYRAICIPKSVDGCVASSVNFRTEDYVKYFLAVQNKNLEYGEKYDDTSFQVSVSAGRKAVELGNLLWKEYSSNKSLYRDFENGPDLIRGIATALKVDLDIWLEKN